MVFQKEMTFMMNRHIFTLILCLGIGISAGARTSAEYTAVDKTVIVSGGIKADALFLNFVKKAAPGAVSGMTPGGSVGGFVQIDFNKIFGLRPELNLNYKQNDFSWASNSGKFRSMGIEIPIYVTAGWKMFDNHRMFIGLGPYTEFCYLAKWEIDDRTTDLLELNKSGEPMIQDSQSGFAAMLGYRFGCGLSIEVSYSICYYNILQPNTSQGVSLFPQTIGFGLAYNFGRK